MDSQTADSTSSPPLTRGQKLRLQEARRHPNLKGIMTPAPRRIPHPMRIAGGILGLIAGILLCLNALRLGATSLPPIAIAGAWALAALFVILGGSQFVAVYQAEVQPSNRRLAIVTNHSRSITVLNNRTRIPVSFLDLIDEQGQRFGLEVMGRIEDSLTDAVGCLEVRSGKAISFQPLTKG